MKNPAENQMGFLDSSCLLKQSLVSSVLLLFVVPFFSYPVFSPAFVTVTVLIVSSATAVLVLFKSSKNKRVSDRDEVLLVDGDSSSCRPEAPPEEEGEDSAAPEAANDAAPVPIKSPEVSSETESVDLSTTTDESDDVDWPSPYNADHRIQACSDDSISDDDSLIELALPDGHYVEPVPVPPKLTPPRLNSPEYSPESVFDQHGLLELFSDINEEDNMIEIDISMGSIKCSRLEIEA
ncbi:hypothetical protein H6P81_014895 [Aristolochia fimbriata]|uniref:Transmembrane protein n=1 Tax=Aristolochia fimbriata TaxID=158543 RepID=A0AAV7E3Q6_ARIFI|nr:hypothetical protein H6P81_014895 [Aristolochia fimbriata]